MGNTQTTPIDKQKAKKIIQIIKNETEIMKIISTSNKKINTPETNNNIKKIK